MSRVKKWMAATIMLLMVCSLQVGKHLPVLRADSAVQAGGAQAEFEASADWPTSAEVEQHVAHISQQLSEFSDWQQAKVKLLYPAEDASGQNEVAVYEVMAPQPGYLVVSIAGTSCSVVEFGHTLPVGWTSVQAGDLLYYLGAGGLFYKHPASDEAIDLLSGDRLPMSTLQSTLSNHTSYAKEQLQKSSSLRFQPVGTPDLPPSSALGILVTAASGSADPNQVLTHGGWVVQTFSTTNYQTAHAVKGVVKLENGNMTPKVEFLKLQNVFLPAVKPFYASSDLAFSWVLAQADSM